MTAPKILRASRAFISDAVRVWILIGFLLGFLVGFLAAPLARAESAPALFSTELVHEPKRPRNTWFPPLVSFLLPGFDQWYEDQTPSAFAYTGTAILGSALVLDAEPRIAGQATNLTTRNDSARTYVLGNQLYMAAGSFSAYASFRSAVRSRKDEGQFAFLKEEESTDELLLAPFRFEMLKRPTTYLPLVLGAALAIVDATQDVSPFAHNGYDVGDFSFGSGYSYLAGTNEEALFRGYLMPLSMQSWDSPFWSNTATATIFALAHLSDDNPVPWPQFALGWYLGYISQKNDWTLSENIFIHAWWDVFAFAGSYLHESRDPRYKSVTANGLKVGGPRVVFLPLVNLRF